MSAEVSVFVIDRGDGYCRLTTNAERNLVDDQGPMVRARRAYPDWGAALDATRALRARLIGAGAMQADGYIEPGAELEAVVAELLAGHLAPASQ